MKKIILLALAIPLIAINTQAQLSKKEAAQLKIMSVEEWETDLKVRKPKPVLESKTIYDQKGNLLEIIERNNDGEITMHEKYQYDEDGNKIVETQFDSEGVVKKKHVYTIEGGLRVLRKTYDASGKLIIEKKYIYKYHK